MTTVTFHRAAGQLDRFVADGHSGYGEAGSDIVCAAVSAATGLTECTINQVLGLRAPVNAQEEDAHISLNLPSGLNQANEQICQTLLTGLLTYLQALAQEFPDNLVVLVDDDG